MSFLTAFSQIITKLKLLNPYNKKIDSKKIFKRNILILIKTKIGLSYQRNRVFVTN